MHPSVAAPSKPALRVIAGGAPGDGQELSDFKTRGAAFLEDAIERVAHIDTADARTIRNYCRGRLAVVRLLRACP